MTRRRPVRRRSRRPSRRQQQRDVQLLAFAAVTAAGIGLVVMVVNWLLAHWWVLVAFLVLAGLVGAGWLSSRRQQARWEAVRAQGLRYGLPQLDALHHTRFEDAVRDLMQRDGCRDAQRVGGPRRPGRGREGHRPVRAALGDPVQAPP
ncbi:hypothetical protein RKD37_000279 [Streptomyces ambofaciens]